MTKLTLPSFLNLWRIFPSANEYGNACWISREFHSQKRHQTRTKNDVEVHTCAHVTSGRLGAQFVLDQTGSVRPDPVLQTLQGAIDVEPHVDFLFRHSARVDGDCVAYLHAHNALRRHGHPLRQLAHQNHLFASASRKKIVSVGVAYRHWRKLPQVPFFVVVVFCLFVCLFVCRDKHRVFCRDKSMLVVTNVLSR